MFGVIALTRLACNCRRTLSLSSNGIVLLYEFRSIVVPHFLIVIQLSRFRDDFETAKIVEEYNKMTHDPDILNFTAERANQIAERSNDIELTNIEKSLCEILSKIKDNSKDHK